MSAILFSSDLAFSSRITGAAPPETPVRLALSEEALFEQCQADPPSLVILDLSTPNLRPAQIAPRLRALDNPPRSIVAVGPHVQTHALAAAADAGCDMVFTRGQFVAGVGKILTEFARR